MTSLIFEPKFKLNHLVLVNYNNSYHIGKVIDIQNNVAMDVKYKIHYQGWSKQCDEWIFEKKLININENKIFVNECNNTLSLHYPNKIKELLVNDDYQIKKKKMVINLPRKNGQTIRNILIDYLTTCKAKNKNNLIKRQVINQIRFYFNESLSIILLYKNERSQYDTILTQFNNLAMDQIYGIEHLCRLFIKLPTLISTDDLNHITKIKLEKTINEIMQHICLKRLKYLTSDYVKK